MICFNCRKEIKNGAKFCPYCGANMSQGNMSADGNSGASTGTAHPAAGIQAASAAESSYAQGASIAMKKPPLAPIVIIAVVAVAICLIFLVGKSFSGPKPVDVLNKMESAYNDRDIYGIIACFEPSVQGLMDGMAGVVEGFVGVDGLSDMLPFASKVMGTYADDDEWGIVELTEISTQESGDSAVVQYSVSITYPDGTSRDFDETMNVVKVDGEWYISIDQSLLENPSHNNSQVFNNNDSSPSISAPEYEGDLYAVKKDGLWGFVDENGRVIIDFNYEECSNFINSFCVVKQNGMWGVISDQGNSIIDFVYDDIRDNINGFFVVNQEGRYGVLDTSGNMVLPIDYDDCGVPYQNRCPAQKDGFWGIIDVDNNSVAVDFAYDNMGLVCASGEGEIGFDQRDEWSHHFVEGLIGVEINGAIGLIDSNGEFIISLSTDNEGIPIITKNNVFCAPNIYDRVGNKLPLQYIYLEGQFDDNTFLVLEINEDGNYEYCIINSSGEIIKNINDDAIDEFGSEWNSYKRISLDIGDVSRFEYIHAKTHGDVDRYYDNGCFGIYVGYRGNTTDITDISGSGTGIRSNMGLINKNGEVIHGWKLLGSFSDSDNLNADNEYITETGEYVTNIYKNTNELIKSVPGTWSLVNDFDLVDGEGNLAHVNDDFTATYTEVISSSTIIVTDKEEVFYGLSVNGKIIKDLEYTSVSYDDSEGYRGKFEFLSTPIVSLLKGATDERYFITKKGDILAVDSLVLAI